MTHKSEDTDRQLVREVVAGSNKAFEALVRKYQRLSWVVISRTVQNHEDVLELNQECFLQVFRYLHTFRFESSLATWIAQVAHSTACKFTRKKQPVVLAGGETTRLLENLESGVDAESIAAEGQNIRALHIAMDKLSVLERTVMRMHYFEEKPVAAISSAMGLAVGTVKSHLSRGRAKLRQVLDVAA